MTSANETRGSNIQAAIHMAKAQFGDQLVGRAVESALAPTLGPQAESRLVSLTWYPARLYADFLQGLLAASPTLGLRAMETLGHDLVAKDFSGPYGVIAKAFSPAMLISWGPRAFARYYRGGDMSVTSAQPGSSEVRFSGWSSFNLALWETIRGGVRAAISACGKPVAVKMREGPGGIIFFDITWKA